MRLNQKAVRSCTACLTAVILSLTAGASSAQSGVEVSVVVAIPEQFPTPPTLPGQQAPSEFSAIVRRYASGSGTRDIILLRAEAATPALLNAALRALAIHRSRRPHVENNGAIMIPAAARLPEPESRHAGRLAEMLTQMRDKGPSRLDQVGNARWIEVADPSRYR